MKNTLIIAGLLLAGLGCAQTKQERKITDFSKLRVSSAIDVVLTLGNGPSLTFEAEESVLNKLKAEVKNGELHIYSEDRTNTSKPMKAYVSAQKISSIDVSGASSVKGTNLLTAEKLSVESTGASDVELEVKVNELEAEITGAGDMDLSGDAKTVEVELTGASEFSAKDLKSEVMRIKASGASNAKVSAEKTLKVNATGASKVIYTGTPKDKDIITSGAATVKEG